MESQNQAKRASSDSDRIGAGAAPFVLHVSVAEQMDPLPISCQGWFLTRHRYYYCVSFLHGVSWLRVGSIVPGAKGMYAADVVQSDSGTSRQHLSILEDARLRRLRQTNELFCFRKALPSTAATPDKKGLTLGKF